jgi:hypothetical protein
VNALSVPIRGKSSTFRIAVGALSVLLGFSFPIRLALDLRGLRVYDGPTTFGKSAFLVDLAYTVVLGALMVWCGWMFLRNQRWGPWTAALSGGAVLIDSLYQFVDISPLYLNLFLQTTGTKYQSISFWAITWLLLIAARLLWALVVLGVALSPRGNALFPKAEPKIRATTLWTTAVLAGLVSAGVRLITLAIGWVAFS